MPECRSFNIKIYKGGTGRCYLCSAAFACADVRMPLTHHRPAKPVPIEKPKKAGSGIFGEPVREREFKPLRYDMMAHARLCMAARRG